MKTHLARPHLIWILTVTLGCLSVAQLGAQTSATLHAFDSSEPTSSLILSSDRLYGATGYVGTTNAVFAINTDGTGFTNLHVFSGAFSGGGDGAAPAYLTLSGNTLYGTVIAEGGGAGYGAVFAMNTDGTGLTTLYTLSEIASGLMLSGGILYGTTIHPGNTTLGSGTVYTLSTDGTSFTILYSFSPAVPNASGIYTNSDGANPGGGLVLVGDTLYGTTGGAPYGRTGGGPSGNGTIFAVGTDGNGFRTLHTFTATDGAGPNALTVLGDTLYGTAGGGGSSGRGTLFSIKTDGTGFTNLHNFSGRRDGGAPNSLISSGNTLYGTTLFGGGTAGGGTVFQISTDGTGFTSLHSFTPDCGVPTNSGPFEPIGLIASANTLYGITDNGGRSCWGTVFSILLPVPLPQLSITASGPHVIVSWPTNFDGFTLQSTTNLVSPAAWITNGLAPSVVNGQNTVTSPVSGPKQFFRLSQ
jgi:uncharacterized repeat protein (TIGR03803 family)